MPANGMMYNGPYVCQCAIATMISGVNAVYNGSGNTGQQFTVEPATRLVKGPAFGVASGADATATDWPTYRYSNTRSAVAAAARGGYAFLKLESRYRIATHGARRGGG